MSSQTSFSSLQNTGQEECNVTRIIYIWQRLQQAIQKEAPPPDKDNILSPMESKIEPQLHIYSQVGKYASAVIKDQVKKNAKPPE